MNKQPLISIIVNCFNGETYLKDCLNSIWRSHMKIMKYFSIIIQQINLRIFFKFKNLV